MKNIFYFRKISRIGGTEQFLYEIAKKYEDWDITIYYDEANIDQLARLRKFVRCKKHIPGEIVKCEKAFFNFNIDMIDDVDSKENVFVSHANFEEIGYKPPINNPKLNSFIGVSDFAANKLDEYAKRLGMNIHTKRCYNPLTMEPKEKVLILVSACRLDDEVKGGKRTLKLIKQLDKYCEENNRHYLWLIFTNHTNFELPSKNVVYMKPRVDVRPYISMADYVVQLSNDMETYCYTINEAWSYGVACVTTPLSICKELPINSDMRLECEWDMSNVETVVKEMFERKSSPFKYIPPEDDWSKILVPGESTWKEEKNMKVKVRCVKDYFDMVLGCAVRSTPEDPNYERIISRQRADEIIEKTDGAIEIIEVAEVEEKEKAVKPTKKVEKAVK